MSRVLVAYGSWCGSTRGVSEAIGEELRAGGHEVAVCSAREVGRADEYDAFVIGSAVRAGMLHGHVRRFLRRCRKALAKKKVALFVVCLEVTDPVEEERAKAQRFIDKLARRLPNATLVSTAPFAGAALTDTPEFRRQNALLRMVTGKMAESMAAKGQQDQRDWAAIRVWAQELVHSF